MKRLPDKSIEICLTDPPYNVGGSRHQVYNGKIINGYVDYDDEMEQSKYFNFMDEWYSEASRICETIIFTPGYANRQFWFKRENFDIFYWINRYRSGSSKLGFNNVEMFFIKGKLKRRFPTNILFYNHGYNGVFDCITKHPHPKPVHVYRYIIARLEPRSVLDPFLGSGSVAQACEEIGTRWIGFEINKEYAGDISNRIDLGKQSFGKYLKKKSTLDSIFSDQT